MAYDPERVAKFQSSLAWSALTRAALDLAELRTWDRDLLREPRVLVPIDVQAYVAPRSDEAEPAVRLPSPLSPGAPDGLAALAGPPPFEPGVRRAPGVHLHWALPDALLRGTLREPTRASGAAPTGPTSAGGGLGLPPLPDRWAVLRLLAASKATRVAVRGWVLDAASARAWELGSYPAGAPLPARDGEAPAPAVPRDGLTGAAGGSLTWSGGYDAAFGRFAWHDPLDDLAADPQLGETLPGGSAGGKATYLIVGWWSDPELDPLDEIRSEGGLAERLETLGWRLLPGGGIEAQEREGPAKRGDELGLERRQRWQVAALQGDGGARSSIGRLGHGAALGGLATEARAVAVARPVGAEASTLLHGAVVGVPIGGEAKGLDLRPATEATRVALGDSLDELVATIIAGRLGLEGEQRATLERLLSAFSARLLAQISRPDGLADLDEARHSGGFTSVNPQEPAETDRVRSGRARIPPRTRRTSGPPPGKGKVTLAFAERKQRGFLVAEERAQTVAQRPKSGGTPPPPAPPDEPGEEIVERPAPYRYAPSDPVLAILGAGRSLRHGGDGRWSPDGRLGVRRPSQVGQGYGGLVRAADLLPSLGSGALPPEAQALAREALLLSPHLAEWLAEARSNRQVERPQARARIAAELALRYDDSGAYTAAAGLAVSAQPQAAPAASSAAASYQRLAAERLRPHSLFEGVEPDPVGITSWAQPWVPLWLEFELALATAAPPDELAGWRLGAVDSEPADPTAPPATPETVSFTARAPLTAGPAQAVAGAVARYIVEEDERDRLAVGEVDEEVERRLHTLSSVAGSLDLMGAALEGLRATLLGLAPGAIRPRDSAGALVNPTPTGPPRLLAAGSVSLLRARLVDAFGRTLDLDPTSVAVPARLATPGAPAAMSRPPRFSAPARCRLRLVAASSRAAAGAVPARVDEIDPALQVSPLAGFLLPDHVDESVEFFSADGAPLGELLAEPVGGGVVWEPAPGRPLPPDAPPSAGLGPEQEALGRIGAGLVIADARARDGRPAGEAAPSESALAAFLRAIDTTLWTVDPVAGAGSSAVGAIVGRPVAVVTATLLLELADDLDALSLDPAARADRAAAYAAMVRVETPVRLGELTRGDDGLLGFFLDGDYTRFFLVDRAVADLARESGRGRGHLGSWGETPIMPEISPIRHPYLVAEDEVRLRPGVPRLVTMLMLPGAAVHVTSGVVPRQKVRLARAWFAAGLERLSPSVRVGPLLVDPGEVRLPLVAALGDRQTLTTREGPLGWRDDAILAATQAALLPEQSAVLREGWIRVTPESPAEPPAPVGGEGGAP